LTDNGLVRRALYLMVGLAAAVPVLLVPTPAGAQSHGQKSACGLVSSATVSKLLGSPVHVQGPIGAACGYAVVPSMNGVQTQLDLVLLRGKPAIHVFQQMVDQRVKPPGLAIERHFVKITGIASYWVRTGVSEATGSSGAGSVTTTSGVTTPQGVSLTSFKHGVVIRINVQGVRDPEHVAVQAMGYALRSL
jgi:hypothetical protein